MILLGEAPGPSLHDKVSQSSRQVALGPFSDKQHFLLRKIKFEEKTSAFRQYKTKLDAKSFSALHVVQLSVREATSLVPPGGVAVVCLPG